MGSQPKIGWKMSDKFFGEVNYPLDELSDGLGDEAMAILKRKSYLLVKRVVDFFLSLIALLALSPVFLIIGIAVKITSSGPVFYKQHRIGMHGKDIYLYKFRSMVKNADKLIESFTPEQKSEYFENYKLEHDPRITPIGGFLRKSSLDELPQLVNILKGEMSFVGPRPVVKDELEKYGNNKDKFLSVKPGLTGYWATHGRSDISYEERMELELYYVEHASLLLDTQIFFLTFIAVFAHRGAC